jgi:opacity protein-like surface antigen
MKRLIIIAFCIMAVTANGFGQKKSSIGEQGVSSVGMITGWAVDSKEPLVGLDFRYNIGPRLRLAPSLLYTINTEDISSLYFNADAHYLVRLTRTTTIYPLAGLGLQNRKIKLPAFTPGLYATIAKTYAGEGEGEGEGEDEGEGEEDEAKDKAKEVTDSHTRLGLNIGFGIENRISQDIILGVEFRHNFTTERIYDQAMLAVRIAYYF